MIRFICLAAAAGLVAGPSPAAAHTDRYHALGTEPFWAITIGNGAITFEDADRRRISVTAPQPRPSFNGHRYVTPRITVDVTRQSCSDGMSDRTYEDTVRVRVDGRELSGCGGAYSEPSRLANSNWRITAINGRAVPVSANYHLEFSADRLGGQAGCNRFSGGYRLSGDRMTPGPVMSTRMACPGPHMANERAALHILGGAVRVSQPSEQMMVLTGNGGSIRLQMVPGARPRR